MKVGKDLQVGLSKINPVGFQSKLGELPTVPYLMDQGDLQGLLMDQGTLWVT